MLATRQALGSTIAIIGGVLLLVGTTAAVAHAQDGKAIYGKNCVMCHGATGQGDGPAGKMMKPPPQPFSTMLKDKSDADVAKLVKEGGQAIGKKHPSFGKKLSDADITALVKYVKELSAK